jgi:hydroxymethylpyrimidine pyrophosphatase-like HAD family hydrolase
MAVEIKTYAFDFDGTLTKYNGEFKGHDITDPPRSEVVEAIRLLKGQGHKILIYSTRSNSILKKWCQKYDVPIDYFNENPEYSGQGNPGKPIASVYIDDRAICYRGQTAEQLVKELNDFKVFYKDT